MVKPWGNEIGTAPAPMMAFLVFYDARPSGTTEGAPKIRWI
jgi:hypothetical protein